METIYTLDRSRVYATCVIKNMEGEHMSCCLLEQWLCVNTSRNTGHAIRMSKEDGYATMVVVLLHMYEESNRDLHDLPTMIQKCVATNDFPVLLCLLLLLLPSHPISRSMTIIRGRHMDIEASKRTLSRPASSRDITDTTSSPQPELESDTHDLHCFFECLEHIATWFHNTENVPSSAVVVNLVRRAWLRLKR